MVDGAFDRGGGKTTSRLGRGNPAPLIDPSEKPWMGKRARHLRGRGKPQLRNVEEVRAYLKTALAQNDPSRRVAACLPLLCRLRSGELRHLRVADMDLSLNKLWIRGSEDLGEIADGWDVKTAASRRAVELPSLLIEDLIQLSTGRDAEALLFPSKHNPGAAFDRR